MTFYNANHEPTHDESAAAWFSFSCQRNPGRRHTLLPIAGRVPYRRDPQSANGGLAQWDWNGNLATPSFTPSIHVRGCCHGYITGGKWDDRGPG